MVAGSLSDEVCNVASVFGACGSAASGCSPRWSEAETLKCSWRRGSRAALMLGQCREIDILTEDGRYCVVTERVREGLLLGRRRLRAARRDLVERDSMAEEALLSLIFITTSYGALLW